VSSVCRYGCPRTDLPVMRCTKGLDFPGLGGAFAIASIFSEMVAVKREVCLSEGNALKITASSDANVGVRSRSASSRTYPKP
jgi:hypothetical protein